MRPDLSRTAMVLGQPAVDLLEKARVAVFGLGGVGGHALEALARAGIGEFLLVDNDTVSPSNLNRQLLATVDTIGMEKVEAARRRVLSINPEARITCRPLFYGPETAEEIDLSGFDYIVDAIDTVSAKLLLIQRAMELGVPIISSMGTGNKLDPTAFRVADISKTSVCPLARVMRRELGKRGIKHLKVVYSQEEPRSVTAAQEEVPGRRAIPGSVSFVPGTAGMIIAGEVIKDIALGAEADEVCPDGQ